MLAAENMVAALRGEVSANAVNPEIADRWRERVARAFA
jgi:hypothetical protein